MCGIIGYVGHRPCRELLLRGLERLEYRGYDSAGLALALDGRIESVRAVGNLSHLRAALATRSPGAGGVATAAEEAQCGIGHTRWATHGRVSEVNAHPHADSEQRVHIVLNGIVENHVALRARLADAGIALRSETDAEVVAHLIAAHHDGDLVAAVRAAYAELRGHYAFVAIAADQPELLVAARKECPLVVGVGRGEHFVASAIPAFLQHTHQVQLVEDGEIVAVRADGAEFQDASGAPVARAVDRVDWDDAEAEKGGFETFMLKEIHEQPAALAATLVDRLVEGRIELDGLGLDDAQLAGLRSIRIVACGTSFHAGLAARYAIEEWARMPVEIDVASEFRYRNPVIEPDSLVIGITQSGETADTLAAMRLARAAGAPVLALTNVIGSQATRDADGVLFTRAGTEIGVAATKTFVAQLAALYVFALKLAAVRGTLGVGRIAELAAELRRIPDLVEDAITANEARARSLARRLVGHEFFLYLGRNVGLPVALEGALKLKEISYIATDAYPAGEMKHGPIALLADGTPVIVCATDMPALDKLLSNVAEASARGAHVIAIATEGSSHVGEYVDEVLFVPRCDWMLQPILAVVPLQLLAYHAARERGLNVDQPRNLAKTVTVE